MARYARRAMAVSAVSAGLFFGFATTASATSDASELETSNVVATPGQDDKQQIRVGDTKPGAASATGSTAGRDTDRPAEASDPSGLMGEATSATRTALSSLGGTPSDPAATSERTGAESQASTGSRNPAPEQSSEQAEVIAAPTAEPSAEPSVEPEEAPVPIDGSSVTDTTARVVRAVPATVDTTVATVGTMLAPLDQATPGAATGLLALTTPVADTVDATGSWIQTVVSSTTQAVDTVGHETREVLCGATGTGPCVPAPVPVPGTGDSGDGLPGTEDGAVPLPVDGGNTAETPAGGDAFPVLLGGFAFPILPRGPDASTLQDSIQTSVDETPDGISRAGGLDQSVPTDEPRPTGTEGSGPGPVMGGAAPVASTLDDDVRLPDVHHAQAVPADAWRLPGSVTFEPGHSPD